MNFFIVSFSYPQYYVLLIHHIFPLIPLSPLFPLFPQLFFMSLRTSRSWSGSVYEGTAPSGTPSCQTGAYFEASLSVRASVCVSECPSVCVFECPTVCASVCVSVCPCVRASVCVSVRIRPSVRTSVYQSVLLHGRPLVSLPCHIIVFVCHSNCLSTCLSVHISLTVCLSVYGCLPACLLRFCVSISLLLSLSVLCLPVSMISWSFHTTIRPFDCPLITAIIILITAIIILPTGTSRSWAIRSPWTASRLLWWVPLIVLSW